MIQRGNLLREDLAAAAKDREFRQPTRSEQRRAKSRRTQARIVTRRDRELRLHGLLGARGLTVRRSEGLYDVLDGRAVVIDGAAIDQLERWFDVEEFD